MFPRSCCIQDILTKKIDKIHRFRDDLIRLRHFAESIGSKYKRNASFAAREKISHSITNIDRRFHRVVLSDQGNVGAFVEIVVAVAQMTFEIFAKTSGFKEDFNISGLTVAYDIQRIFGGQKRKGFLKVFI